jgi:hypothetical protein
MNAMRQENNQRERPPKIKAKKQKLKPRTYEEICKLITKAEREGPDSLSPEELDVVVEYNWDESVDGDKDHLLKEVMYYLNEGPDGIDPEQIKKHLTQKDNTALIDAKIVLFSLITELNANFDWPWKKGDKSNMAKPRKYKDGLNVSREAIAKAAGVTPPCIKQAEDRALKKFYENLYKDTAFLKEWKAEVYDDNTPIPKSPTDTSFNKENY